MRFYGPVSRRTAGVPGVWMNDLRAFKNGFSGNVLGEGFVLGGVFVIRQEEQGKLLEHREMEFADKVNTYYQVVKPPQSPEK
uniref:Uncharacterized protein n=1 Tax=Amphiprion percula TaxID=161767 RepID=A0A3P8U569_AMPPE